MPVLTFQQVYALAREAGLNPPAAVIATAIAKAESGLNTDAVGDTTITTDKWGPSVGLWQVRSVRAETGKGTARDINRLKDPVFNAKSMVEISGGGKNWRPWSVFLHGTYKAHLPSATAAGESTEKDPSLIAKLRAGVGLLVTNPGAVTTAAGVGLSGATEAVSDAASSLNPFGTWQSDAQGIALKSLVIAAGAGLFVAGAIRLVLPAATSAVKQAL